MANKKKIFDRLENLNIPNSSKNEIFNLIEDIEVNIGDGLKYEDDKIVVSIGTAIAAAGGNDRSGLVIASSSKDKKNYIAINAGDGLEIDERNRLNVTGGKIPEIIDEEIYYNDGSGQVVPIKHPDLSTQPSILPYKFMGQYVYEQVIPKNTAGVKFVGDGIIDIYTKLFAVNKPVFLSIELIGEGLINPLSSTLGINYIGAYNEFVCTFGGMKSFKKDDGYEYIHVVYTSMPEENSEYYYRNDEPGLYIEMTQPLPLSEGPYLYNGNYSVFATKVDSGKYWIHIPLDYSGDVKYGSSVIFIMANTTDNYEVKGVTMDGQSVSYTYNSYQLTIEVNEYWSDRAKQGPINIKVFVE